jgi:hypothetical protein
VLSFCCIYKVEKFRFYCFLVCCIYKGEKIRFLLLNDESWNGLMDLL